MSGKHLIDIVPNNHSMLCTKYLSSSNRSSDIVNYMNSKHYTLFAIHCKLCLWFPKVDIHIIPELVESNVLNLDFMLPDMS